MGRARTGCDPAPGTGCASRTGLAWGRSTARLGRFVYWLQHEDGCGLVRLDNPVRGARRVNGVLAAVREFICFAVATGQADPAALEPLYDLVPRTTADTRPPTSRTPASWTRPDPAPVGR
ncbi:hypothetical protein ACWF9B_28075 [Streptomyces sp. NPDC055089]